MKAIQHIKSHITPLMINDIDTDIIIPAQFLTQTSRTGYGQHAFSRLKSDPEFVLNQPKYQNSRILLAGDNFGCGSSREHAVWAIQELGFEAIIAPSFADIFSNNARKNGLLLIQLDAETCQRWADHTTQKAAKNQSECHIHVQEQILSYQSDNHTFALDPFFKWCLSNGKDDLDYLLAQQDNIDKWQQQNHDKQLFLDMNTDMNAGVSQ